MNQSVLLLAAGLLLPGLQVTASAQSLYVNDLGSAGDVYTTAPGSPTGNGTSSAPFATVAAALQAASPNSTIYIDAGTYSERVVLDKNVSLQGAGSATIFDGGLAAGNGQTQEAGFFITAAGGSSTPVKLSKFTVRNYDFGILTSGGPTSNFVVEDVEAVSNRQTGIFWNSLSGTQNLTFRRVRAAQNALPPNTNNNGAGRGLFIVNGHKQNILIEDSRFEQNRRGGLDVNDGSVSGLAIRNNQFTQNAGAALAVLGAAGERASGVYTSIAALIENNAIRDNASNGMELKACTGTGLGKGAGSFVVRNNYIARGLSQPTNLSFDNAGIAFVDRDRNVIGIGGGITGDLETGGAFIQSNTVRGYLSTGLGATLLNINGFGVVLEGGNNKVFNNIIAQCQRGVQVQDRPATTTTTSTPFFDIDRNTGVVSINDSIRYNRIDSCATALRAVNLTKVVEAGLNWLGSNSFEAVRGADGTNGGVVTLGGPTGFASLSAFEPTGFITYSPFLNSRTDASATPGFQADLSFLNVDRFCPTPGPIACLQKGVNLVTENGTVHMFAAMYDQDVIIAKSLTLTNSGSPTTIQNLTLNGLSKVVTLGSPLRINGNLALVNGFINSTATNLLTILPTATSTPGSSTSFVNGPVQKIGNTAFIFPIGKDTFWARLGITAPSTATASFTAEYFPTAYASAEITSPLRTVSRVEYWNLNRTAGTDNVQVQLFWENGARSGITEFSPNLQVARFNGTAWSTEGNGGLAGSLAAGSVLSAAPVSEFGAFTFGSVAPPLPVELVRFQATPIGNSRVQLRWATATELHNEGFGLERSLDGKKWQQIVFVQGKGSTSQQQEYTYSDQPNLFDQTLYYRLRQQDTDGKSTYSSVATVTLSVSSLASSISVYPNPAALAEHVRLALPRPLATATHVQLLDLTGRLVLTQIVPANATEVTLQLSDELAKGTYLVQVTGLESSGKPIRLVKQ
ncbi:T9SS type A sorting domain-containing protein [Hymenobacter wooponensis]|uniref:T9SS type A sorting domain-containing protein n=1 Tax=Hymenobacter wooponensis TaxID=1525360 RepID=A0A4Z0MTK4_9BACT|nr:T9SS type A sorting domain-containing protein [Hymenobacter wooponensis]TGD83021.1 T9SS type A sorting domain-containing protein [Hymenobacter wooponensis]